MSRPDPLDEIAAALTGQLVSDDEAVMVRRAALRDPPLGCPMHIDGYDVEPGGWRELAGRDGLPPACPVKPLGMGVESGEAWFIDSLGRLHCLKASASGKGPIEFMFAGRLGYLPWAFPRWRMPKNEGEVKVCIGYDADEARRCLIDACGLRGVFSEEDRVRGRGAWRDDDGTLIYHAGDMVWIGGKWLNPGEHGGMVYPARPSLERPWGLDPDPKRKGERVEDCAAGDGSPGDVALQILQTWNWDRGELDARLALGWVMTAMVGGALDQRPNLYVDGEEGSGKSTLQKVQRALMGGALVSSSNTTQAGVYQKVRNDSVAVFLDESEASVDPRVSDRMLQLARIAYSGDKMLRGGADHHGKEFTVMSSFLFSSIARPAMDAQDLSRMALLTIRPREVMPARESDPDEVERIDLTALAEAGRQLLRRWVEWWDRWETLKMRFWKNLRQRGHSDRSADTFSALAAGCHVAMLDDMPDAETMDWWMERLDASQLEETAGREKTWQRAFMHIFTASPEVLREKGAKMQTLGDYVQAFKRSHHCLEDLDNALRKVGLAISFPQGYDAQWDHARLFVPCKHPALNALYSETNWCGRLGAPGPWTGVLRQAPRNLWKAGVSRKGYVTAMKGTLIDLPFALEACAAIGEADEDTSRH